MIYRNEQIGFQTLLNDRSGDFEWRKEINFSSEELESLKNALRKHGYHEFKIFQFVRGLEEICRDVLFASSKPEKYSHQSRTEFKEQLRKTVAHLKKTKQILNSISAGNNLPFEVNPFNWFDYSLPGEEYEPSKVEVFLKCRKTAEEISEGISFLLQVYEDGLSDLPKRKGSPGTISEAFATKIENCFQSSLGPTTTTETGPFCEVLEIAFESVGLSLSDPKKLSRKVVKNWGVDHSQPYPDDLKPDWSSWVKEKGTQLPNKS